MLGNQWGDGPERWIELPRAILGGKMVLEDTWAQIHRGLRRKTETWPGERGSHGDVEDGRQPGKKEKRNT